ncbi:MAG: hypothetical protein ACRENT_01685 [Thermodesulfobacteriota bacterium]
MQANQSPFINRQRKAHTLIVCFALTGLFILISLVVRGRGSQVAVQVKLSAEDPRPVAKAIEMLEAKYGWVITYEDPRYVHNSEIVDVALKVRRDLDKYKPGEVPPVFIPKGGVLEFTYEVASNTELPADPAMVVQKLLSAQAASSNGGRFRLESRGKIMHVIPTAIKNREGNLTPQGSVLDTIISLPAEERTVYQKLESICAAITRATKIPFVLGTIPDNWFSRERDQQGAMSQKARDVLVNTFEKMDYGTNLSWQLFYGPGTKRYVLNIHLVSKRGG